MAIYNVRKYSYFNSEQIRLYTKPVIKDNKEIKKKQDDWKDSKFDFDGSVENYYKKTSLPSLVAPIKPDVEIFHLDIDEDEKRLKTRSALVAGNRAKQKVYELVRANKWDWFLTFTFNREKVDSSNYDEVVKKISAWLKNQRNRYAPDLKYVIVPELHADGVHYHFHGLLADCGDMKFVDSGIKKKGKIIYNLSGFDFGFTTASKVEDSNKAGSYILKYITKELSESLYGRNRYLASRNLSKPIVEELNLSKEEIEKMLIDNSDKVMHMKSQTLSGIQSVNYIELRKD